MNIDNEQLKQAKIGSLVPIYKVLDAPEDPIEYFAKLSDYGRKKHCLLLESADIVEKYGQFSIGSASPCLRLSGKGSEFELKALNAIGKKFLLLVKKDLTFCQRLRHNGDTLTGALEPVRMNVSEDERLKLRTHMDILRAIAFRFKPTEKPFTAYAGLFGCFSYDFIDQFEDLPKNEKDAVGDPDYEFYFCDNLFMIDHKTKKLHIVANALITDKKTDDEYRRCKNILRDYEKSLTAKAPLPKRFKPKKQQIVSDTTKEQYERMVVRLKENIVNGDIFQAVPSRTITSEYNAEPLDIYSTLRSLNPSPYMFFINTQKGILLGSSPEMFLKVEGDGQKTVEIRPIAGTKPRGFCNGGIDKDLDSRYEAELKIDKKELAEHTMLIDLARNDIARIAKPGTRYVDEPYVIEKYSHVQHLVSNVRGTLKDGLDALHAYLASMNMGTLTGAPKVKAMELLRKIEKTKRGFYGGSVGYLTPSGDFDSAIIIRAMRLVGGKANVRVGAGVVYDSIPESEYEETEKKARGLR